MGESIVEKLDIYERCFEFSKAIVELSKTVKVSFSHKSILEQLLRSATSISANMMEVSESESRKDFVSKLSISIKEAKESLYWLRLLQETGISSTAIKELFTECGELIKILASIKLKVTKKNSIG